MDLVLAKTSMAEGKNGKTEEKIEYMGRNGVVVQVQYKGNDPRTEYYNTKGEVGFIERTEEDKKIAEKAGLHWDGKSMHGQDFQETIPEKVDAYQKQQALLKQKMAEKRVK